MSDGEEIGSGWRARSDDPFPDLRKVLGWIIGPAAVALFVVLAAIWLTP